MKEANEIKSLVLKILSHKIKITNPAKLFWPEEKITKLDLVKYYLEISDYILPFIRNRPQSLHRYPDGYSGKSFYQKNVSKLNIPDWITTKKIKSTTLDKITEYLVCDSFESLIFMINLGCIEIHPWNSMLGNLNYPDWIVFDLDPQEIDFIKVIKVANGLHEILEDHKISSFCKTSGAEGLHIYVPNKDNLNYKEAKNLSLKYATELNLKFPDLTSLDRNPSLRRKKIYIDYLQNNRGQTTVAPYSVRPLKGAPVSTPITWNELNDGFNKESYNIKTVPERLKKVGEVWRDFLNSIS